MPRRASYSLATIRALPSETAYASPDATRRQMIAAEALIASIDPTAEYALAEAIGRVLGTPYPRAAGEIVSGRELRANLATLVLDLSERLALRPDERAGGARTPEEFAREIGVASKTLQRWRRAGLCAHWVVEAGRPRVAIFRACLEEFAARHRAEFERARGFRRFDAAERSRLLGEGRALVAAGRTVNLAAKELAARFGRSHEGVRLLFLREFGVERSPRRHAGEQAARLAERAWRLGIEPARIAARLGRSESLVRAIVDRRRAEILRGVQPSWVELPTFDLAGADETICSAPAVRRLQPLGLADGDFLASIASSRAIRAGLPRDGRTANERDETRAAAMHYLLRRASRAIDALPRWPERARIDAIETDLRLALRLRALLVERGTVLALGRADQLFAGTPERLTVDELRQLAHAIVASVRQVVGGFDPSRQRFDRAIALAVDFALAKRAGSARPSRAAARHQRGIEIRLLGEVARWQELADPLAHRAEQVVRLCEAQPRGGLVEGVDARLIARRHGFAGFAPRTVEALAAEDRTTVAIMTKRLREAEAALRARSISKK